TQSILHHIKYEGNTDLAESVGTWFGNNLRKEGFCDQFDLILPVPLHEKKLKKRGYNQSELITRGMLSPMKSVTDNGFLIRTVNNPTQTHKNRIERVNNVSNIFKVNHDKYDQGIRILLVDDVVTTGATLESCAKALYDAGYENISFAAVAFARK
ncbi:MAG TPA: phosphoribosyltransferase family protein, partial [Cyclobacteriaceae bacterium]|nr:phosphoribosyltransferase family protein [Cyclobacteriaceae bacterium]